MNLRDVHPHLAPTNTEMACATATLQNAYADYTRHVSPPQMAMSLPACAYIYALGKRLTPKRCADFGSGFTSYVLRETCDEVDTFDDSLEWLTWTSRFLERRCSPTGGLHHYPAVRPSGEYGLMVYDFGYGTEYRTAQMAVALDHLAVGGVCVVDDAFHPDIAAALTAECQRRRYDMFDASEWTVDRNKRFCAIAIRGEWSR